MASKMMISVVYVIIVLLANDVAEAVIGMNWGRQTAQRLLPSQVVDLLLQNGIKLARVFSSDEDVLKAFVGSGIDLTISIFKGNAFTAIEEARAWVQKKAPYFINAKIRGVFLGEYMFSSSAWNKTPLHATLNSLQLLQTALIEGGYGDQIKVSLRNFVGDLKANRTRPSEAEFLDEIKEEAIKYLRFLQANNAPFVIEMTPIIDANYQKLDPSFLFLDDHNNSTKVIKDINGTVYTNIFEYTYDSFVWALSKLNASNVTIVVGGIGWPTDGYPGANATTAERFFKRMLPVLASNKGTPMRPGTINSYIHSLTDENQMPFIFPFMRHWGIYRSNGQPKYKIDLSGQGRDIYPTTVKGIQRMPRRWCVFNGDRTDMNKVNKQFASACNLGDCSSMAPGGSCSKLGFPRNVSYAFNMHFQVHFQDETSCDFGGLGYVALDDPSTEECVFPVEVVKGQQVNLQLSPSPPGTGKGFRARPSCSILVFFISILGTLFWN